MVLVIREVYIILLCLDVIVVKWLPRVNLTILDKNNKYLDLLATVLDTTRSQVINDILVHIDGEDLEVDIWEGWEDLYEAYSEFVKAVGEEEGEEEDEDEEDKEEDLTDILSRAKPIKFWTEDEEED